MNVPSGRIEVSFVGKDCKASLKRQKRPVVGQVSDSEIALCNTKKEIECLQ